MLLGAISLGYFSLLKHMVLLRSWHSALVMMSGLEILSRGWLVTGGQVWQRERFGGSILFKTLIILGCY